MLFFFDVALIFWSIIRSLKSYFKRSDPHFVNKNSCGCLSLRFHRNQESDSGHAQLNFG